MKCFMCEKEIDYVFLYYKECKKGILKGSTVVEQEVTEVMDLTEIECPNCGADLSGDVDVEGFE